MMCSTLELPQDPFFPVKQKWQRPGAPVCCPIECGLKRIISVGVSAKNPTVERSTKFTCRLPVCRFDDQEHAEMAVPHVRISFPSTSTIQVSHVWIGPNWG